LFDQQAMAARVLAPKALLTRQTSEKDQLLQGYTLGWEKAKWPVSKPSDIRGPA
jgi:hypothetical protein